MGGRDYRTQDCLDGDSQTGGVCLSRISPCFQRNPEQRYVQGSSHGIFVPELREMRHYCGGRCFALWCLVDYDRVHHTSSCSYSIVSSEMCRLKFRFSLRRSAGPFTLSCVVVVVISIVAAGAPFLLFFLLPCFSCSFVVVLSPERLQLCRGLELFVASVSNYWLFYLFDLKFYHSFYSKNCAKYHLFLLWFVLFIQVLQE